MVLWDNQMLLLFILRFPNISISNHVMLLWMGIHSVLIVIRKVITIIKYIIAYRCEPFVAPKLPHHPFNFTLQLLLVTIFSAYTFSGCTVYTFHCDNIFVIKWIIIGSFFPFVTSVDAIAFAPASEMISAASQQISWGLNIQIRSVSLSAFSFIKHIRM